jgi:signal peptidase
MDTFVEMYQTLRDMRKRQLAHQVLNLAMIVCSALMIWKSLMVITESESPVVVVLSGSMEPAFHRGDILFLHMGFTPFRSGDIVVFKVADREIPIVHRIIKVHEKEDGTVDLLTKGDNNAVDDRGLYAASQSWIHREHVIGRAKGCASERGTRRQRDATPARTAHTRSQPPVHRYLPYIGMVTIIMNDYPIVKYILVGLMGLFVLTTKE